MKEKDKVVKCKVVKYDDALDSLLDNYNMFVKAIKKNCDEELAKKILGDYNKLLLDYRNKEKAKEDAPER